MKIEKIELGNYLSLENYSLGDKIESKICDSGRMEKTNFQGVKSERLVIKIDGEGRFKSKPPIYDFMMPLPGDVEEEN